MSGSSERIPDRRGVPVTTTSAGAAAALDEAVLGVVQHRADTAAAVMRALALDPQLVVAHAIVGFGAKLLGRRDLAPLVGAHLGRAQASLAARGGTAREELLVRSLAAWCEDDPEAAVRALDAAQEHEPLDLLSMKLAHAISFLIGRTTAMRDSLERVLPAWERSGAEGLGSVLGCHAFTTHELGDAARAEAIGRRAVALEPRDPWAVHAVAHTLHSRDLWADGLAWLDAQPRCLEHANNFGGHVHWHRARFLFSLGRLEEALRIHDQHVATQPPGDYRDLVSSATLLFRLERAGLIVADRWERLATVAESRIGDHGSAFADAHHVLVLDAAGRHAAAERFVRSMHAHASSAHGRAPSVHREVAVPVARAILSAKSDPALACELLTKHASELGRLGGSHA